jgi:hypothetical protein
LHSQRGQHLKAWRSLFQNGFRLEQAAGPPGPETSVLNPYTNESSLTT